MEKTFIFAGFGGQGMLLIGKFVAMACMLDGKHVSWLPSYGPEMRGGTANCSVIVSDDPVASPLVDKADVIVAGGAEAAICECGVGGFNAMKALSTRNDDPTHASRPFSASRDGFVMGEGAGCLILEELEHAKARGAHIYAEVVGYGANCDAYHFTAPAPGGAGAIDCMALTLADAGIAPEQVDHINAHGTGTHMNDACETAAIHAVFGEHAKQLTVVSTKSMTGHLLGGAGGIEAVFTALALRDQFAPPTIHYAQPDPECDLDYVPNAGRAQAMTYALSNSLGFGGHNACIALRRWEG